VPLRPDFDAEGLRILVEGVRSRLDPAPAAS
jgi:hypothetical protein